MSTNISPRIPDDLPVLERSIRELQLPDGHWQIELRHDLPRDGVATVGPFRLTGAAAVSAHITRTATAPVGAFVGDPGELDTAFVSLMIQAEAAAGMEFEVNPKTGRAGAGAAGAFRWVHHRRVSQQLTVQKALTDLLTNLKSPYDLDQLRRLDDGEVLEVRRDTTANAALAVTWDAAVLRELVPVGRVRITAGEALQVHSGAATAATGSLQVSGRLTVTVERGDLGDEWVRLRLRHHRDEAAAVGLQVAASLLPQGIESAARILLDQVLGGSGGPTTPEHPAGLVAAVVQQVVEQIRRGATASLGAALNRTRGTDALAGFQFRLPSGREAYFAAISRGDLAPAQQQAGESDEPGVIVEDSLLQRHLRRHRTATVNLRLLGLTLERETGRLAGVRVTEGADGALWLSGQAAATLSRRTRRQIEDLAVLFDLHAAAGPAADSALSASLERTAVVARGVRAAAAAARRHAAAAVALGRMDPLRLERLLAELAEQPLPYTFRFSASLPPRTARRIFALDDPGLGPALYRARLWAVYSTAVRMLGLTVPTTNPRRPCPIWLLITEERIAAIRRQPFLALEPHRLPPLAAEGHRFDRGASARGFWLHLAHAHTFIEAVARTRQILQRDRPVEDLSRTVSSLANMAARLRDQTGWLSAGAAEDRHLMLPLLAGADECELRLTFTRGALHLTV